MQKWTSCGSLAWMGWGRWGWKGRKRGQRDRGRVQPAATHSLGAESRAASSTAGLARCSAAASRCSQNTAHGLCPEGATRPAQVTSEDVHQLRAWEPQGSGTSVTAAARPLLHCTLGPVSHAAQDPSETSSLGAPGQDPDGLGSAAPPAWCRLRRQPEDEESSPHRPAEGTEPRRITGSRGEASSGCAQKPDK